jgi:hypothetical protein
MGPVKKVYSKLTKKSHQEPETHTKYISWIVLENKKVIFNVHDTPPISQSLRGYKVFTSGWIDLQISVNKH